MGKIWPSYCPTFHFTCTSTNPLTSKWGRVLDGCEKKSYEEELPAAAARLTANIYLNIKCGRFIPSVMGFFYLKAGIRGL